MKIELDSTKVLGVGAGIAEISADGRIRTDARSTAKVADIKPR
ncbi:MAG: hypothetical protein AB7L41_02920 [Flavobacteriaceae bacterium]